MDEYYKILGVSPDADDAEIEEAYQKLKAKYSRDRFADGEIGNQAARNLTKLEEAYEEIMDARKYSSNNNSSKTSSGTSTTYDDVQKEIKAGNLGLAQELLDGMSVRDAEWHYLESVIFYKKNWMNESKRQLELAMEADPNNPKYKSAYDKLVSKMEYASSQFNNNGYNAQNAYNQTQNRQMGGDGCLDMCATYCCIDFMCHMCCR